MSKCRPAIPIAIGPRCGITIGRAPTLIAIALVVLLAGCSSSPAPQSAALDPADPAAPAAATAYRSTTGAYTSRRPVEPGPWRQQNERVAPTPKQ
jgi:hypothetical protein